MTTMNHLQQLSPITRSIFTCRLHLTLPDAVQEPDYVDDGDVVTEFRPAPNPMSRFHNL